MLNFVIDHRNFEFIDHGKFSFHVSCLIPKIFTHNNIHFFKKHVNAWGNVHYGKIETTANLHHFWPPLPNFGIFVLPSMRAFL